LIFAEFSKIKRQKSAILDCAAILEDFQKRFSTKSSTTKRGRVFENLYF
jgi:hypothetical protein